MNLLEILRIYILKKRHGLLKLGLGSRITDSIFENYNAVFSNTRINHCKIGLGTYISNNSFLANTLIGRYCSIADNVHTCNGQHPTTKFVTTFPSFYYNTEKQIGFSFHTDSPLFNTTKKSSTSNDFEIVVGNDVWIGSHALLMPGITVGDGAIIAAGSVVTKDVPPYSIVGGVPAKVIKMRFNEVQIQKLLQIKWWNKPFNDIKQHYRLYSDIDTYLLQK